MGDAGGEVRGDGPAQREAVQEDAVAGDVPPDLSGMTCEYDAIRKVHPQIEREGRVDIPESLADRYLTDLAHADRTKGNAALILAEMGDARLAYCRGQVIARRQPHGDAVNLVRVAALPDLTETETAA